MKKVSHRTASGEVDWQSIRARLDQAASGTEVTLARSPEKAREVMNKRAQLLARVPPQDLRADDVLQVVTFGLADERYAVETRFVWEVVRLTEYTPLPGAPPFLVGIINLRGEILAVFDLRKFFDLPDRGLTDLSRIIVLGSERGEFGVLADTTHEVTTLRTDEVFEAPESAGGIGREHLAGVTRDLLIILNGAVLLRDSRLVVDIGGDG